MNSIETLRRIEELERINASLSFRISEPEKWKKNEREIKKLQKALRQKHSY